MSRVLSNTVFCTIYYFYMNSVAARRKPRLFKMSNNAQCPVCIRCSLFSHYAQPSRQTRASPDFLAQEKIIEAASCWQTRRPRDCAHYKACGDYAHTRVSIIPNPGTAVWEKTADRPSWAIQLRVGQRCTPLRTTGRSGVQTAAAAAALLHAPT